MTDCRATFQDLIDRGLHTLDSKLIEKIGALEAKVEAAHSRLDKLEFTLRDDIRDLKAELKELNAFMHKGRGWAAALVFLGGASGAGIAKLLAILSNKS